MTLAQRVGLKLFFNPHLYSGAVISRMVVCVATLLWSLLVFYQTHDPRAQQFSSIQIMFGHNLSIAMLGLGCSAYQVWETLAWRRQTWASEIASVIMTVLWSAIVISFFAYLHPLPPAGTASTFSVMLLSWWNVLVTPRTKA